MTIDKKILEDPLKIFDFLSERVYSDAHPASPEFIRKMREVIKEMPHRGMQYTILAGYVMLLEADTFIAADLSRMQLVCEVEAYLKTHHSLVSKQPKNPRP